MQNKGIAYNIIGNIIVYLSTLAINFILSPYIVASLGVEAYGYVQLANNFVNYVSIVTIALTSMAGRFISIPLFQKKYDIANKYFNSVFYATAFLSILLTIAGTIIILNLEKMFHLPQGIAYDIKFLFALIFAAFIVGLYLTVYSIGLFVENKIYLRAKKNIESSVIRALSLFGLYFFLSPKLYFIGVLSLFVNLYMSLWNIYYTKKYTPQLTISFKYFNYTAIKEIISSGIWNSINQLSAVLNEGLDLIITNLFIGSTEMGILSIAKIIPNTLSSLLVTLGEPFMPKMTEAYAQDNSRQVAEIVNYGAKIIGFIMIIPIAGLIVFGEIFFKLWQPTQNSTLLHILSIICIVNLILSCSVTTVYGIFTITNKLKLNSIVGVSIGFINCGIVFILLKFTSLGIYAVAGVSVFTAILRNLVFTFPYASRCLNIKWYSFHIFALRNTLSLSAVCIIFYIIKVAIAPYSWGYLFATALLCIIIGFILNFLFIFTPSERKKFINTIKSKVVKR